MEEERILFEWCVRRRGGVCWLPLYFVAEAQYDAVGLIPAFPGTGGILFY